MKNRTDRKLLSFLWTALAATALLTEADAQQMYFTDGGTDKIQRADLAGSSVVDLVTVGPSIPHGIALDIAGGKMYWANANTAQIQRANLDGSALETLTTLVSNSARNIALDVPAGKMYWTDTGGMRIQRANLDGTNVEDLATGLDFTRGIALDLNAAKMYWTKSGVGGKILRANLEIPAGESPGGRSDIEELVTGLVAPEGLALDLAAGKMYWAHQVPGMIQRANLDGSDIEDLVTSINTSIESPTGIALDIFNGKMYWTDSSADTIQRANLDGSDIEDLVTGGLTNPNGVALALPSAEACCFNDGSCTDEWPSDCEGMGGTSQGIDSMCHGDNDGDGTDDACLCAVPPAGMTGWWPLDETSGTVAEELINGKDGTHVNGPTPLLGQFVNNSLCFVGTGVVSPERVEVPDDPALNFGTGDFSIDAWIRTYDPSVNIVWKQVFSTPVGQEVGFMFTLQAGRLSFMMADGIGNPSCSSSCPSTDGCTFWNSTGPNVADGTWHHVAVTADRDSTTGLVLYVDGVDVGTFDPTCRQGSITNTDIPLIFASGSSDLCIDEVELFDQALTATQVEAIYFAGPLGKCQGCDDEITRFVVRCKPSGKMKASLLTTFPPGTSLTLTNNGGEIKNLVIDPQGRGKATWSGQPSGPHEICIVECPQTCKTVDCPAAP